MRKFVLLLFTYGLCLANTANVQITTSVAPFTVLDGLPIDEKFIESIPESVLDVNRSVFVNEERIFVPMKLPRFSRIQKWEMMKEAGLVGSHATPPMDLYSLKRKRGLRSHEGGSKVRRALDRKSHDERISGENLPKNGNLPNEKPWRRDHIPGLPSVTRKKGAQRWLKTLIASDPHKCPTRFDAVTEGFNKKIYVFAGEYVYQTWREDGLQQRAAYLIPNLFPDGPRRVSAAFTNRRSGVTVLISYRSIYRYRWSKAHKQFYLARNSPQVLGSKLDFLPTLAFQWKDGHLILGNGEQFVTYDPFRNLVMHKGKIKDYFPNLPKDTIGLTYSNGIGGRNGKGVSTFMLLTAHNGLQIYDLKKSKVVQEYPISVKDYVACLSNVQSKTP
ncbi:matrix metalloproteinase-C [Ditylenchus destructor]|uniref:Matrix metalloproteinase-C n=1 Tax=Ditylenchus destructor TaxID=166010 RepID=A0AAD4RBN8_9BILA|nr:matrix metalloproteinase-C [Ditylenchus destructor]